MESFNKEGVSKMEYQSIIQVLKRDKALRMLEESRIFQKKVDLQRLRKKGALRQGLDSSRSCARCMAELGMIINRGAECPGCRKKVCNECRFQEPSGLWLCVVCHKQLELKAVSGEWMDEISQWRGRRASASEVVHRAIMDAVKKLEISEKQIAIQQEKIMNNTDIQQEEGEVSQSAPVRRLESAPLPPRQPSPGPAARKTLSLETPRRSPKSDCSDAEDCLFRRYTARSNRSSLDDETDIDSITPKHKSPSLAASDELRPTRSNASRQGSSSLPGSSTDSTVGVDDMDCAVTVPDRSQVSLSSYGLSSGSVTSVYSAAGGHSTGVQGEVLFGLSYNYQMGCLEVDVKQARGLAPPINRRSDPYVKAYLLPDHTKHSKRKTRTRKNTLDPVFDEVLKYEVTLSELQTRTLWLSVWRADLLGHNDFLGEVKVALDTPEVMECPPAWRPLQEHQSPASDLAYKGDLLLAVKFVPPDVTQRAFLRPGGIARGSLHVLVKEARNLMATRANGTSDPFCKSYLLPDRTKHSKQKTQVVRRSCNPRWNHTFVYEGLTLEELKERCLELSVWDRDRLTSNDFLGGLRLSLGRGECEGQAVDWMDSLPEETIIWRSMLDKPNQWIDCCLVLRPSMRLSS